MNAAELTLTIREFQPGDEAAFRSLNEEWITRYFTLEWKDRAAFDDPQKTVLDKGGRIFFAVQEGRTVGCCALVAIGSGQLTDNLEVSKMAVTARAQGSGVGRALLSRVIDEARRAGVKRLYIETNHTLTPAISLYRSLGFETVAPERFTPSPYARADVYLELFL